MIERSFLTIGAAILLLGGLFLGNIDLVLGAIVASTGAVICNAIVRHSGERK